jgi:hypothetical protein
VTRNYPFDEGLLKTGGKVYYEISDDNGIIEKNDCQEYNLRMSHFEEKCCVMISFSERSETMG